MVLEYSWESLGLWRSNQSILKEISPEYSLKGLMLKLKLQYFSHLMQRAHSLKKRLWCWERLKVKGEEGCKGWDSSMSSPTQWTWIWANFGRYEQGSLVCCSPWSHRELNMTKWLNNNKISSICSKICLKVSLIWGWHYSKFLVLLLDFSYF